MSRSWCAAVLALLIAAPAGAQDPVGNFVLALDRGLINLDNSLNSLAAGDTGASAANLNATVTELATTLARDTAGEPLAAAGTQVGDRIVAAGETGYPPLDRIAEPGAEALAPVTSLYTDSGVLANGLPLVDGRDIPLFADTGLVGMLPAPMLRFVEVIEPGGPLSTGLGQVLAGEVPETGMAPAELPLPAESMDAATRNDLQQGRSLPGLEGA